MKEYIGIGVPVRSQVLKTRYKKQGVYKKQGDYKKQGGFGAREALGIWEQYRVKELHQVVSVVARNALYIRDHSPESCGITCTANYRLGISPGRLVPQRIDADGQSSVL